MVNKSIHQPKPRLIATPSRDNIDDDDYDNTNANKNHFCELFEDAFSS
jgi:hypothetical protein